MCLAPSLVDVALAATVAEYRWQLLAEVDPQLPARVLACFSVCNGLPELFCLQRPFRDDFLCIAMRSSHGDDAAARRLALRMRGIPSVIELRLWSPDGLALLES